MNIEAKLLELYGNCKRLDNGTYYVKAGNGNELYIPATIDPNQSLLAYTPGAGGSGNDAVNLRNMCQSANPPSCVVAIAPTSEDNNNILNIGTNAINNLGGQVNNVVYASFSAGGMRGLEKGETYLQNNPDVSMSIVSCDGVWTYGNLSDRYPTIKSTETPFIILTGDKDYKNTYNQMTGAGYNAYYLQVNNKNKRSHIQLNKDMINYLLLYTLGESDEIPENDLQYQLYKNSFNETVDFENMRCDGAANLAGYDRNKYKDVLKLRAIGFNNLDKYSDTDSIGGYVKADFDFISTSLNQIRSTISKSNIATKTPTLPVQGANSLSSTIAACIEKYSTMTVNLYTKLAQETEATASYAQSLINLDLQHKGHLQIINNGIDNQSGNQNGGQNNQSGNQNGGQNNQSGNQNGGQNNQSGNNNGGQNNNSGNNNNTGNQSDKPGPSASGITPVGTKIPTTPTTQNPIINGNEMTWKYEDGHNLTLTLDNGVLKEMKFTYTYNTVNELNNNINNILVGQIDKQYFEKMTIVDKSVEVIIKPDFYKELTIDKIKELFFKEGIK